MCNVPSICQRGWREWWACTLGLRREACRMRLGRRGPCCWPSPSASPCSTSSSSASLHPTSPASTTAAPPYPSSVPATTQTQQIQSQHTETKNNNGECAASRCSPLGFRIGGGITLQQPQGEAGESVAPESQSDEIGLGFSDFGSLCLVTRTVYSLSLFGPGPVGRRVLFCWA